MGRCSTCNGPTCGNCLECHNPDCKDSFKEAIDPRGQCHYKGKPIPIYRHLRKSAFDKAWGLIRKKSWDGLDDDEGWDDSDPFACRGCGYNQTPAEWEMNACKKCGTRNTLHPMYRSGGVDNRCNICGDDPSPRSYVCEECILESPLYLEMDNLRDEGMMVNVETGDVHNPDMAHALYNLYDYYDKDTGEKIEKSMTILDKAWGVVKSDKKKYTKKDAEIDILNGPFSVALGWVEMTPNGPVLTEDGKLVLETHYSQDE